MTSYNPSSFDPSMRDDLPGIIRFVLEKFLQNTDDLLPAQVVAFNRSTNRVSVQPLISIVTTSNTVVPRAQLQSLPILQLGSGGFVISFPISVGDTGWVKAVDRDMSLFLQGITNGTVAVTQPNTARKHSFSDAVFIPDTMFKGETISSDDAANAVWQNLGGTTKISLGSTIRLKPSIGVGAFPRAGAIIDAPSTTQAIGFPAMSSSQKTSIASPQPGYTVFDSTLGRLSTYNGSTWS